MLELYHEARLAEPISAVFAALLRALARGRWANAVEPDELTAVPRTGFQYSARSRGRLRRGEVVECLRPVSIVLLESLQRSPSFVHVRQRWRVQPLPGDTRLSCELKASLNRMANLQRRHWEARFARDVAQLLDAVRRDLEASRPQGGANGVIGQRIGSASIVNANKSTVNGKPILR